MLVCSTAPQYTGLYFLDDTLQILGALSDQLSKDPLKVRLDVLKACCCMHLPTSDISGRFDEYRMSSSSSRVAVHEYLAEDNKGGNSSFDVLSYMPLGLFSVTMPPPTTRAYRFFFYRDLGTPHPLVRNERRCTQTPMDSLPEYHLRLLVAL